MKAIVTAMLLMLVVSPASAVEELVLELNDKTYRTQGDITKFPLKRSFKDQFGTFDWDRYDLRRIDVVAKSRAGNGQMWLEVGDAESKKASVDGERDAFDSSSSRTFREYGFKVPSDADLSRGWRLAMRGNFKVRYIKATLNDCHLGECKGRKGASDSTGASLTRVLDMGDKEVGPGDNTIYLKRLIKEAYPKLNMDKLSFNNVTIVAKSRQGRGVVSLQVGDVETAASNIGGSPDQFNKRNRNTFYPLAFNRPAGADSDRVWQLHLKGQFRIREISVGMNPARGANAAGAAGNSRNKNQDKKKRDGKKKKQANNSDCRAGNCPQGKKIVKRAKGNRSCYRSGDGRYIDKRNGALVLYTQGCQNGKCVQKRQQCFESRTCVCSNGSGRCKEANSCGAPKGCSFGYNTVKMHCGSDIFTVN